LEVIALTSTSADSAQPAFRRDSLEVKSNFHRVPRQSRLSALVRFSPRRAARSAGGQPRSEYKGHVFRK
jgi:hypothetical protein